MVEAMMEDVPLRTLIMFGGDAFNRGMAEGLLLMINGKFSRLAQVIKISIKKLKANQLF
jgi:hypothetical protein